MKYLIIEQVITHSKWTESDLESFLVDYTKFLNDYKDIKVEGAKWEIVDESEIKKGK